MRKLACALGLVLAVSATAAAQKTPKADVFVGYSFVRVAERSIHYFNAHGGSLSLAYNLNNFLGVVGDVGIYHRRPNTNIVSYLFGPRLSIRPNHKISPYAQVLLGGAHTSGSSDLASGNVFAMTVGGGVDAKLSPHLGLRLVQAEYFPTRFSEFSYSSHGIINSGSYTQNNVRVSTGIVFRFGK